VLALRIALGLLIAAVAGAGAFWLLTMPRGLTAAEVAALPEGDAARGERWFWASGCAACHAAPGATGDDLTLLGGGRRIESDVGTFVVPNISPHPADGIGGWSVADFANAMQRGISPDGRHLYPAFPYPSYIRMSPEAIADLWAFLQTLPPVEGAAPPSEIAFPFSIRRGIGLWKRAFLSDAWIVPVDEADPVLVRGRALVEGAGHCGECHTPRNLAQGLDLGRWLAGGPNPDGAGRIPNITGGEGGIGDWSESDIAYYLETGFTPDFDVVGGSMSAVQRNLERLPGEDRDAIASYLKAVPPRDSDR